ncbi:conserved hypothetical protein [sediment metagenome]|uniref:PpiC domain-containing protein n=1 Tax=sediment metagenome TaxID=749907 RepID=D9PL07_9ZZZZ
MTTQTLTADSRFARVTARWPDWLREPLLHFVLLGAILFGVDYLLAADEDDLRVIVVGAEVEQEARQLFKASRGRDPNPDEMRALRQVWLDNEVLYREGLALQVDRGDQAIRERVIFKALSVVDANLERPPVDEKVLREWFEKNRAKYDQPARYDFEEAVLAGDTTESAVRSLVSRLNDGTPGDVEAGLRVFRDRPHENIVQSYGEDFARQLEASPAGVWQALPAGKSWRAMRLQTVKPAVPAEFEALAGVVLQDWTDAVMAEQRTAAVRALAQKYTIRDEQVSP